MSIDLLTVRLAFRQKMRQDASVASSITDPKLYQDQEQLARDVADILLRNIVQGTKVTQDQHSGQDTWRMFKYMYDLSQIHILQGLHIRPDTELGSNDTIKGADTASSRSVTKRDRAT